eukprot:3858966-Karenia_brevis.AAC.1
MDFEAQGLSGERLLSGVTTKHDTAHKNVPEMTKFMGTFKASRSLFVNRKIIKEYLRGGSDGPCRDFDITKSFTRARAHRGGEYGLPIDALVLWIQQPETFAERCGVSVAICKEYVTAAPTCGKPFLQKWLASASLAALPPLLDSYTKQVRDIGKRDVCQHDVIVKAYLNMGYERGAAETKTSYQLDCQYEWHLIQQGMEKVSKIARVRALELDGLVVSPLHGHASMAFEAKVQAKLDEIEPGLFKLKPYRSLAELEVMIRAEWPADSWDVVDNDWEDVCKQRLHVHRRLVSGESPAVLIAPLVPYTLMGNGKLLKDMLVSAKMGKDNWYWWTWQDREFGGFWAEDHSDIKGWFEMRVVECLCQIMGVHVDWAWPSWVSGTLTSA